MAQYLIGSNIVDRLRAKGTRDKFERDIRDEAADKIEGMAADLGSALECLWKRGDRTARMWCKANYPTWSAGRFDPDATSKE